MKQRSNCVRSLACVLVAIMFLTIGASVASGRPGSYRISGTVTDAVDSQPLVNAYVILSGGASSTYTNSWGGYSFTGLPSGSYYIDVTKTGFWPNQQTGITINEQSTVRNVAMSPHPGIHGIVTSYNTSAAMASATVTFNGGSACTPDANGRYYFAGTQYNTGTYAVKAQKASPDGNGYWTQTISVYYGYPGTPHQNFQLIQNEGHWVTDVGVFTKMTRATTSYTLSIASGLTNQWAVDDYAAGNGMTMTYSVSYASSASRGPFTGNGATQTLIFRNKAWFSGDYTDRYHNPTNVYGVGVDSTPYAGPLSPQTDYWTSLAQAQANGVGHGGGQIIGPTTTFTFTANLQDSLLVQTGIQTSLGVSVGFPGLGAGVSVSIPIQYTVSDTIGHGKTISVSITNSDSVQHTYNWFIESSGVGSSNGFIMHVWEI